MANADYITKLVAALDSLAAASRKGHVGTARRHVRALHGLESQAADPDDWAAYVNCLALVSFTLANWAAAKHNYQRSLALICKSWRDLDERDKLRGLNRLPPSRGIRARLSLVGLLAELKWRDPENIALDTLLDCETQAILWCNYSEHYLAEHADRSLRRESRESVLWGGVAVAAMAFKFAPDNLRAVVVAWNMLHADPAGFGMLSPELGHWRRRSSGERNAFYWWFEICKEWLSGGMTADTLNLLYAEYTTAAQEIVEPYGDDVFLASIRTDKAWMRRAVMQGSLTVQERTA